MKKERLILLALVGGAILVVAASLAIRSHAQSPTPTQQQVAPPVQPALQVPTDPQTALDIQGNRRYLVGPGDLLDVRVFGQSDLNSTVEIDDEGNISSLPFIETPIPALCHNEKEIQKAIAVAYSKYLKNPKVSVRVMERHSRPPASVFGAVRAPARVGMMRRVRLHELLAAAGGITQSASGSIQIIHTERQLCAEDMPEPSLDLGLNEQPGTSTSTIEKATTSTSDKDQVTMTPVSTQTPSSQDTNAAPKVAASNNVSPTSQEKPADAEDGKWQSVPLSDKQKSDVGQIQIYQTGDVRNGLGRDDPYIRPGDIVIVTEGEPIYVNGFVNAPREIVMKDGMTLGRALAMAGGIQKTAKGSAVRIYRLEKGRVGPKVMKVDYDAIKKGGPDFMLQAYDIIDVRPSSMVSPSNLVELFKGISKGTMGSVGGSLPYRILY